MGKYAAGICIKENVYELMSCWHLSTENLYNGTVNPGWKHEQHEGTF